MGTKLACYTLIGNSRAAALVSNKGSIDWCCLPEFDSPSLFASLLDQDKGGYFSICPTGKFYPEQRYLPDTNVIETLFRTREGEARLTDAFIAMTEEEKTQSLFPDHEILRVVEGITGTVRFKLDYVPRTYYGKHTPRLEDNKAQGIRFYWKENIYTLLSTLEPAQLKIDSTQGAATAAFEVKPGDRVYFSLSYSNQSPAVLPELYFTGWERLQRTIRYWKNWIDKCKYKGLYEEQVRRSALTLKLLTHAPSGAIIAAPTTSLPERIGGARNWDYRYCWLRDASFTTRVLIQLGFEEEAQAYMNWILHATQLTRPKLQVVYSVFGHASLEERTLDWLNGYSNSKPVRVGNGADNQFQLDVYGEVLDAVYTYAPLVEEFDRDTTKFLLGLGEILCKEWQKPDNGIWEIRSDRTNHTHSMVMAWVGLDRLMKLSKRYKWKNAPIDKYASTASEVRKQIEQHGFNEQLGSYVRELRGSAIDASLLTLPLVGYCDPASPRMKSTIRLIKEKLTENSLVYRYKNVDDGLEGSEGAFGICSFWLAENLARAGDLEEAISVFETMLQHASPSGLMSEEVDPKTGELLGNYPQGFTHIGLINAALTLNEVYKKTGVEV